MGLDLNDKFRLIYYLRNRYVLSLKLGLSHLDVEVIEYILWQINLAKKES